MSGNRKVEHDDSIANYLVGGDVDDGNAVEDNGSALDSGAGSIADDAEFETVSDDARPESADKREKIIYSLAGATAAAAVLASVIGFTSGNTQGDALSDYADMMAGVTSGSNNSVKNVDDLVRGNIKEYVDIVSSSSEDQQYSTLRYNSPLIAVNDVHVDSEYIAGDEPKYHDNDVNDTISGEDAESRHVSGFSKVEGNKSVVALRGTGEFIGSKNGEKADQPFVALVSKVDGDGNWKVESVFPYSQDEG